MELKDATDEQLIEELHRRHKPCVIAWVDEIDGKQAALSSINAADRDGVYLGAVIQQHALNAAAMHATPADR